MRLITSIAFMVLMCAANLSAHAADSNPSQLMLTIKLSERLTSNAEERTIANPTLVVTTERPFRFHVGGTLPSNHGGDDLTIGTRVHGKVEHGADGKYKVALTISVGEQSILSTDDADIVQTQTVDIRTTMASRQTKRFQYSTTTACSISLESVNTPHGAATSDRDCGACGKSKLAVVR